MIVDRQSPPGSVYFLSEYCEPTVEHITVSIRRMKLGFV